MDSRTPSLLPLLAGALVTGLVVLAPALPAGVAEALGVLAGAATVFFVRLLQLPRR